MKVPELKADAKRLGLRGYSHMRKPQLISLIAGSRSPILDEINPEINSEILKPTKYVAPQKEEEQKIKSEIRELEEMLGLRRRRIIPEIKVWTPEKENLHRKIRKIKEINRRRLRITETVSALRGFERQFRGNPTSRSERVYANNSKRYPEFNERKSTDEGQDDSQLRNDKRRAIL